MSAHDRHDDPPPAGAVEIGAAAWIRPADLRYAFARSRGPGGQSVNKVSSRAELRVEVEALGGLDEEARERLRRLAGQRLTRGDELVIHADVHRSPLANKRACLARLVDLVDAAATPPTKRKRVRKSRAMIEKRLAAKRRTAEKKRDRGWRPE